MSDPGYTLLQKSGRFTILARGEMEKIAKEQELSLTKACDTTDCAVEYGQALSVEKLVVGSVSKVGAAYLVVLKLVDVEKGTQERAETRRRSGQEEVVADLVEEAAAALAGVAVAADTVPPGALPGAPSTPTPTPPPAPAWAGPMRVPEGCRAGPGAAAEPYTGTGWAKEIVHEATGIEMVYVPAGSFEMGSPAGEAGRINNETQHQVTLTRGFYLGKYEVTQGQWEKVMGSNPSRFVDRQGGFLGLGGTRTTRPEYPVEEVSWNDCQQFVAKLNASPPDPRPSTLDPRPFPPSVCRRRPSGSTPAGRAPAVRTPVRSTRWRGMARTAAGLRTRWGGSSRTSGGCTTCTATSGSGARTGTTRGTMAGRRTSTR